MKECVCGNVCDQIIKQTGGFEFMCHRCGIAYQPNEDEKILYEQQYRASTEAERNRILIEQSAFDPTNTHVRRQCKCGRTIMVNLRLGEDQKNIYSCMCGYTECYN